ncbi:hypothetical protein IDVR_06450 [Intrasporangium sp. DVR]
MAGAPAQLQALIERLYSGSDLGKAANADTTKALTGRTSRGSGGSGGSGGSDVPPGAEAALGSWFGTPIAVVTAGKDVSLAVGPTWKLVGGWWPSLGVDEAVVGGGPRWVLAVGSDARRGQNLERSRADTLQVIGTDGAGGGGVMGIARDLWVTLSTGGKGKINSAMSLGGPEAQLRTVRTATGLPIEGYAVIGFDGFIQLVDHQGGIRIVVPETVDASHAHIVIKKGPQTLSGKQALAYARERKTLRDGDFGRSRHQGQLLLAAAVQARLAGPEAVPGALISFSDVGVSDLSAEQMLTFAAGLYRLNPTKVGRDVAAGPFGWAGAQSIVVLGEQARRLFASFEDGNLS